MVASGTLQPGARLPTIRQLAADLGLAKGTIERAYELLEGDAVIERHGRNGSYVSDVVHATEHEVTIGLQVAAETLVIVARQLGADQEATLRAVRSAWQQL
jgi:DNA-binding transcriptional regulator YhcF (GntR family)